MTKLGGGGDTTSGFMKAQDKFLSTLGQGFGDVAKARNDGIMSPKSSKVNESRVNQTFDNINYFEERCKELQAEIDEWRKLEGADENS